MDLSIVPLRSFGSQQICQFYYIVFTGFVPNPLVVGVRTLTRTLHIEPDVI
jgi:hypothetical protein